MDDQVTHVYRVRIPALDGHHVREIRVEVDRRRKRVTIQVPNRTSVTIDVVTARGST